MRFKFSQHFLLICIALAVSGLLFAACVAPPYLEKTPAAASFVKEFSSAKVAGKEITVLYGQAVVMYSDHLPQAGGSGDEAVSKAELKNQLKILAYSPPFERIPAHQIVAKWSTENNVANHYTSENDIPCLAA